MLAYAKQIYHTVPHYNNNAQDDGSFGLKRNRQYYYAVVNTDCHQHYHLSSAISVGRPENVNSFPPVRLSVDAIIPLKDDQTQKLQGYE